MATEQANSGRIIAQIALTLPERPTTADVLTALGRAYQAGCDETVEKLGRGILRGQNVLKRQAL